MYQLYIANKNYSSWSLRPWLLMTQLRIAFEEKMVAFETNDNWQRFRQFAPNGRVPCLLDNDTVVWDSLAITEYLAERHAGVWPQESKTRAWARCAVAEMHSGFTSLRGQCPMQVAYRIQLHNMDSALQRDVTRVDELWCEGLNRFDGPYLTGADFTAVDAFFAPVAFRFQTYGFPLSAAAQRYANVLLSLPAMQSWQASAIKEPWRDEPHDIESRKAGVLLQDLRQQ